MATRDTPRTTGTVPERVRRIPDDPTTEVVVSVARFEIKDDDAYNAYSAAGHCGKPASGKCLYCSNHYAVHENDPTTRIVRQYIDNRGANGNKGRQNVILCAHVGAITPKPSNIVTPTAPATHTPTMNAITNARTEKEITMSTTNNTPASVNLDAITAQIAALNAALAALNAPATTTPATSAPATTTPATSAPATNTAKKPVMIHFDGGLIGTFTANAAIFSTGNTGWRGQVKAEDENGDKYQITFMASKVGGNPNKPPTTKTAKK